MSARTSRLTTVSFGLAALSLGACSALVSPDPSRLGGIDSGIPDEADAAIPGNDTGPRPDAAIDAFSPLPPDGGRDGGPVCPPSCDDDVECTIDACEDGRCTHEADDSLCPGGRCSVMLGCTATVCTTNEECDDGDRCNGAERCDPSAGSEDGCVDGTAPDCNDGVTCTDDFCAPETGCYHDRHDDRCDDDVDCTTDVCTGTAGPTGCEFRADDTMCNGVCEMGGRCTNRGCTDTVPRTCPLDGSPCTVESCDESLGGCVSEALDADGDGYPAASATGTMGTVTCAGGTDCNDGRAAINPGAMELCGNGADDDCNPATSDVCAGATGDTCATARPITLSGGTGSATVMFGSLTNDYRTHCGGDMGRDAVLYFDVTTTSDVRIETTGAVDTVLATATTCSNAAFEFRCNDDRNPGSDTTSRLWVRPVLVSPGSSVRVYVLVEEYSDPDADPVTVTVTLTPTSPNSCPSGSSARPLDISGGGTVLGNLQLGGVAGSQRGSCQSGTSGNEAMFRIEEADRTLTELELTSPSVVPDLYVRYGGCALSGTTSEISCVRGGSTGGSGGSATQDDVSGSGSATLFYVFADGFPITGGEYTLRFDP